MLFENESILNKKVKRLRIDLMGGLVLALFSFSSFYKSVNTTQDVFNSQYGLSFLAPISKGKLFVLGLNAIRSTFGLFGYLQVF